MNRVQVTMDDLPVLAFEGILSYLSLEDRIKARAVSRRWCQTIDSFRVKSLCFSEHPRDFIIGKARLVSGAFAQNFISSPRFSSFFNAFYKSILSCLKHLRLCDLHLNEGDLPAFAQTLNLFVHLKELDLFCIHIPGEPWFPVGELQVNLPMLNDIQLEKLEGIRKLTLNAPKLQKVRLWDCLEPLRVDIVHGESVEMLITNRGDHVTEMQLKNLKYLHKESASEIEPTFLSGLKLLKEIYLDKYHNARLAFEKKRRYGRVDLKIYLLGLALDGPDNPAIIGSHFGGFSDKTLISLAENPSRLVDEIPLCDHLHYWEIGRVSPEMEINLLKRFVALNRISVYLPVQNIDRFLALLKNLNNIVGLVLSDQPHDLFDRLPEYCPALQKLIIHRTPADLAFLARLKHLVRFQAARPIGVELIRKILEEHDFLLQFKFTYLDKLISIVISHPKRFEVSLGGKRMEAAPDVNSVIQFITENVKRGRLENLVRSM